MTGTKPRTPPELPHRGRTSGKLMRESTARQCHGNDANVWVEISFEGTPNLRFESIERQLG